VKKTKSPDQPGDRWALRNVVTRFWYSAPQGPGDRWFFPGPDDRDTFVSRSEARAERKRVGLQPQNVHLVRIRRVPSARLRAALRVGTAAKAFLNVDTLQGHPKHGHKAERARAELVDALAALRAFDAQEKTR
jgi:hypothetical protein